MTDDAALFDVDSLRWLEAAERRSLGEGVLMGRAGQAAWRALLDAWPQARRIVVACGSGGNGGDGFVLARHALEAGREVRVVALDARESKNSEALEARRRYVDAGGGVEPFGGDLPEADVIVDAVLGIGLSGVPSAPAAALIDAVERHDAPVLSLDVPSGIAEGGDIGPVVTATRTIEFLLPKLVLRTGAGVEASGVLEVASLGVDCAIPDPVTPVAMALHETDLRAYFAPRRRNSHKGQHGRVLCVGGDVGTGGAVLLVAEAALRCGAGLVRVHTHAEHVAALLARLPEAMSSTRDMDPRWATVVAIGPGLGRGEWGHALFEVAINAGVPLVLDADALNLLAAWTQALSPDSVLTPHPGEASRLLGCSAADIQRDRLAALTALVERFKCVVVLKGAGTLVGAPGRVPALVAAGGPALATGGTGDVLTGAIAALRAQGLDAFDAACAGALLHASAGDAAARDGERGLRATDLMSHLRRLANP